ncbi:hypothetical protein M9Y10_001639 [Tritrichomonas musculus]|uniref:Protein kinase domain-containing protein n=1 Tax=Tritrichomonas musculus TaxID=1915356 RepID=A0ABR2L7J4_9EUKA
MSIRSQSKYRKYIVDINDFKILNQIQSGGFGSVYSVYNVKTGDKLAAKIIRKNEDETKYKKMINREIGIMIRCQHPTIIKFMGYSFHDFEDQNNIVIFMELSKKGSLADFLEKIRKSLSDIFFDNTARQIILIGISYGMMYLHQHRVIHRDLKPDNILLDDELHPIITDFGLSKLKESIFSFSQTQQCGTSIYMAPEVFENNYYSEKSDVYSFGILMYEVVTDSVPYPLLENHKITPAKFTHKVMYENYRPEFNVPLKKSIQKLIERCWSKEPKERPTFEELFKKLAYNIEDSIEDICNTISDDDDNE